MSSLLTVFLGNLLQALLPTFAEYGKKYGAEILSILGVAGKQGLALGLDIVTGTPSAEVKENFAILLDEVKVYALSIEVEGEEDAQKLPLTLTNAIEASLGGAAGAVLKIFGL